MSNLYFLPEKDAFSHEEEKLLALFKMREEVKLGEVESYLNVSRNTATRKLNQLIKTGKVRREGKGPSVKYMFNIQ